MSRSQNIESKPPIPLVERISALQARNKRQLQLYEASRTSKSDMNKENSLLSTSVSSRQNKSAPAEHVFDLSKVNDSIPNTQNASTTGSPEHNVNVVLQKSTKRPHPPQAKPKKLSIITEKNLEPENCNAKSKLSMQGRHISGGNQLRCRSNSVGSETPQKSSQSTAVRPSVSTPSLHRRGGSSQVFEVYDETLSEVCALKVVDLGDDPLVRQCYLNEIKLLKSLQGSPYVIKMLDYEFRESEKHIVCSDGER
ncbi:hypothetical protein KIN20_007215 [Parelaphostrongylus tenuis]|uniref:Protein kinase domain-containing protein n=1 Tax=Parelaphostrongylus tenuis TaxID=148309 RepID=A0AAD5MV87_PARTN|nr:hypothetical protein KIN20_007215 [Parelaphostrongylus tenuis]